MGFLYIFDWRKVRRSLLFLAKSHHDGNQKSQLPLAFCARLLPAHIRFFVALARHDLVPQEQPGKSSKFFQKVILDLFVGGDILASESCCISSVLRTFNPPSYLQRC